MYSREERIRAVELYIEYDKSAAAAIRELGYPDRHTLRSWHELFLEEQETGIIKELNSSYIRYTPEQKRVAVDYYLTRGRNLCRTVRSLGYPSRDLLAQWCKELALEARKKRVSRVQYTKKSRRLSASLHWRLEAVV